MKRIWPALVLAVACSGPNNSPKSGGGAVGLALLDGDGQSTALSLVDPRSSLLAVDDCLDPGAAALSGDVVLPSTPQPDQQILLIDRARAGLDWIAPASCQIARQLDVGTGFAADPHDVVAISATKSYVTRYATNPAPSGSPNAFDGGDDLLIIDPTTGQIIGRIDLSGQATSPALQAQPDRALMANGKVYVSLANASADSKTVGHGRVVVVDPKRDAVSAVIDLPALKSCSGLDYLPATRDLVVGCGGDRNAALDDQTAQSAIVLVNLGVATPTVMTMIAGAAAGNRPLSSSTFAVIGDDFVLAVSPGDVSGAPPDSLWRLQLDSGTATHVLDGDAAGVFGGVVWDSTTRRAYLTNASATAPRVRVFDVSNPRDTPQIAAFVASPKSGLPPRLMAFY